MSMAIKSSRVRTGGGMAGRINQGDPGLLGGILGAVGGFVTGGPLGAVGGAIAGYKSGGTKPALPTTGFSGPSSYPVVPTPGVGGAVSRLLPGGKTGYQVSVPATGAPPRGMRLNKSGYFLRDGTYVAPGTRYVKIRRRNSMNPRALSRAMARVNGAKRIQAKLRGWTTDRFTSGGEKKAA